MSSFNLETLTSRFPDKRLLIGRMDEFLQKAEADQRNSNKQKYFSISRLFDAVSPGSKAELIQILTTLVEMGVLRKIIRLESEHLGTIEEFASLADVPSRIYDEHLLKEVPVGMDDLKLFFCLPNR